MTCTIKKLVLQICKIMDTLSALTLCSRLWDFSTKHYSATSKRPAPDMNFHVWFLCKLVRDKMIFPLLASIVWLRRITGKMIFKLNYNPKDSTCNQNSRLPTHLLLFLLTSSAIDLGPQTNTATFESFRVWLNTPSIIPPKSGRPGCSCQFCIESLVPPPDNSRSSSISSSPSLVWCSSLSILPVLVA